MLQFLYKKVVCMDLDKSQKKLKKQGLSALIPP